MLVTTNHQYIEVYPIRKSDRRLIIGTIHPHLHNDFQIPFFYGNVGSIWGILSKAFPQHDFTSLQSIITTLKEYETSITDIIKTCDREHANITRDDLLYNIVLNKEQIEDGLSESQIDTIYFTSRFSTNSAAKLFVETFRIDYKASFNESTSEFTIPKSRFGREIRCVVLYSPSGAANVGISQTRPYLNSIDYYRQFEKPVARFKVDFYKEKFNYFDI